MKLIIAGSRHIRISEGTVEDIVICAGFTRSLRKARSIGHFYLTEVVCGGAKGIDTLGALWAISRGIPIEYMRADWEKYGKGAGPIRNREMAEYADALILIWDGVSRGSKNMKKEMLEREKPVYEVVVKGWTSES